MKLHVIIFLCFHLFTSCSGQIKTDSDKGEDKKMTIISNPKYTKWITGNDYNLWNPDKSDLIKVNEILNKALLDKQFYFLKKQSLSQLQKNYRQYICYLNEKGEKIVYINSMCELSIDYDKNNKPVPFDWKNEMIQISDGGDCYWNIKINLNTEKYYDLMINGQG
jgi:hypothetical protein